MVSTVANLDYLLTCANKNFSPEVTQGFYTGVIKCKLLIFIVLNVIFLMNFMREIRRLGYAETTKYFTAVLEQ